MGHRVRSQLIKERTALGNQIRGLLYGIVIPQSLANLRQQLPLILEDVGNELSALGREVFADLYARLVELDERIAKYDQRIQLNSRNSPVCQRLEKIPGIGPVISGAIIATAGDGKTFKNGRQFAAWLGLTPVEEFSGGKERLLGISRRGDKYVRSLLVQGAQAVLRHCERKTDSLSCWINRIRKEKGVHVAAVALANKLARIVWAVLVREQEYRPAV